MRPLLVVLLAGVLGCERPGLKPISGDLVVTPQALAFEPTFIGFSREGELVIGNRSRASRPLSVTITGPFVAANEVIAAAGAETSLKLAFAPTVPGDFTGTLELSDESGALVIELTGAGLATAVCTSSGCETSTFDPELGRCVAAQSPDGTSCSDGCILGGKCSSGRCIGPLMECSDGNPCTLDACEAATGCIHPPAECTAPTNPCKAARCDPSLGCVESDVRDGVACGEANCVTAQVCIAGLCKAVAVPDGAACGEASPCQAAGTCQQAVCVRPAPGQLTETWSYTFPGPTGSFEGISDGAQNLYWLECAVGGLGDTTCDECTMCGATSYTRDGVLRFRKALSALDPAAKLHHVLAGDVLVYAAQSSVGAISTADGAARWSALLPLNPAGASDVADAQVITSLTASTTAVTLTLSRSQAQANRESVLLQLNPLSGAIVFAKFYDGALSAPVLDEAGALTFKVMPWYTANPVQPQSVLLSLSPSGVERWRVLSPPETPDLLSSPAAVFQGELLLEDGELRSMADGSILAAAPEGALTSFSVIGVTGHPLMGPSARLLLRMPPAEDRVNAISLGRGAELPSWEVLVHELHGVSSISATVATANGGFLVAAGDSRHPTLLKGFDAAGAERFTCELPWNGVQELPTALLDGRWVALEPPYQLSPKLHVYDVGAELPATHGWTGKHGSPAGGRQPRP